MWSDSGWARCWRIYLSKIEKAYGGWESKAVGLFEAQPRTWNATVWGRIHAWYGIPMNKYLKVPKCIFSFASCKCKGANHNWLPICSSWQERNTKVTWKYYKHAFPVWSALTTLQDPVVSHHYSMFLKLLTRIIGLKNQKCQHQQVRQEVWFALFSFNFGDHTHLSWSCSLFFILFSTTHLHHHYTTCSGVNKFRQWPRWTTLSHHLYFLLIQTLTHRNLQFHHAPQERCTALCCVSFSLSEYLLTNGNFILLVAWGALHFAASGPPPPLPPRPNALHVESGEGSQTVKSLPVKDPEAVKAGSDNTEPKNVESRKEVDSRTEVVAPPSSLLPSAASTVANVSVSDNIIK